MDEGLLLSFFQAVRSRLGLNLEMVQYGDLLKFAKDGYAISDRKALLDLSRALWLVDPREKQNFENLFDIYWPSGNKEDTGGRPEDIADDDSSEELPEDDFDDGKAEITPNGDQIEEPSSEEEGRRIKELATNVQLTYSRKGQKRAGKSVLTQNHEFDFSSDFHPVGRRILQKRWRDTFRSEAKYIDKKTIDVTATVSLWAQNGILSEPVHQSQRLYPKKILLLTDHLGSMEPFSALSHYLFDTFLEAIPNVEVVRLYFHNHLSPNLFKDPGHTKIIYEDNFLSLYGTQENVLVIFSDAGAMRQQKHSNRLTYTATFLQKAQARFEKTIWINPVPRERWIDSSAASIAEYVSMIEFSSKEIGFLPRTLVWNFSPQYTRTDLPTNSSTSSSLNRYSNSSSHLLWFWEHYGHYSKGHWDLLEYAGFVPAFSAELLYKLRKNAPINISGQPTNIPYIAVADILLSPLCQSLGMGLFQLKPEVQLMLPLSSPNQEEDENTSLRVQLARFLLYYAQDSNNDRHLPSYFHYWQALFDRAELEENLKPKLNKLLKLAFQTDSDEDHFEQTTAELHELTTLVPEITTYVNDSIVLAKGIKAGKQGDKARMYEYLNTIKEYLKPYQPGSGDIFIPLPQEEVQEVVNYLEIEQTSYYRPIEIDDDLEEVNLLEEIVGGYFIQQEEKRLKEEGKLKIQYYFDSFDVMRMIEGAIGYDNGVKFDKDALMRDDRQNFVYALAFNGLLKEIHLLPPHQFEFESKLYKSNLFLKAPKNRDEFLYLCQEVLFSLGLKVQGASKRIDFSKIDEYIRQLIEKGGDIFKANYLLREYTWAGRLKYLIEKRILIIEQVDTFDIVKVEDTILFRKIKKGFDTVRPDYPTNNYYDTLAFFHLQQKLEDYIDKPEDNLLPVFYVSSPGIRDAVKIIRDDCPELFAYKQGNKLIPIIRDSLFFVLEAVFSVEDNAQDFFQEFRDYQEEIRHLIEKEYERYYSGDFVKNLEYSRKQFEERVREIINVKFIQEIWIKHKAYQKFIDELKAAYSLEEEQLPLLQAEIRQTLESVLDNARIDLKHSQKLSAIIETFQTSATDIKKSIGHSSSSDVFREFALMKFGLDQRKSPLLQGWINELTENNTEQEIFSQIISDIVSSLAIPLDSEDSAIKFLNALTVAWLLDKHKLIDKLYSELGNEEMKKRYEIALIYAASHITIKRNLAGIKRTREVIDCILSQVGNNYKVWIGVGYLFFRLWESKTSLKPDLPEMHMEAWINQRKSRDYKKYIINGAVKYTKMTLDFLSNRMSREGNGDSFQLQNYLYALSQLIYYTTRCGARKEFEELVELIETLHSYEGNETAWQTRFYRTLSWYYLRKSLNSTDENLRQVFLQEAEQLYSTGKERNNLPKEYTLYAELNRAIIRVKENKM
ncbi:MAG: hypothetical protein H6559_27970 [Lewinellaceae bacterium]|nr:hypothetical protein [Lewinellaceae bacterium]